ncbi:toll/interleukin-1 receptor domain-containing protein [Modestobacter altitudinis]|uniref:toll/interleukin-1 receptor domain-containing protein n=1 Tax=Modestobacter altitudinis TaxID=2213158 RepID=UPI00148704A2|nr:toll/interleukin-1 receptor domain-containing protein [Modestobacter altitudinis]
MKVFLSWSGDVSKQVAGLLREWLPLVINEIEPFMSSEDIDKGSRGLSRIASELQNSDHGIVVVTEENCEKPWINFEAGALSKVVEESRVTPLLFGVEYTQITGPLTQFQHVLPQKEDIRRLLDSINRDCDRPLSESMLGKAFDQWWPQFARDLLTVRPPVSHRNMRSPDQLTSETLQIVRSIQRELKESRRSTGSSYGGPLPTFRVEYAFTNTDEALQQGFIDSMNRVASKYGLVPVRPRDADYPTFVFFNI